VTKLFRHVEHNGYWKAVILPRNLDERFARFPLHVGRVDHRQSAERQSLPRDEVQYREGVIRHRLIVLFVADQRTAGVRRQNLGRQEMLARESALS
jgi:hypothetical protein